MASTVELQQEVLDHQFSNRYSTRIITWLDGAQKRIVRETDIRTNELDATIAANAGDQTLTVPSDFARLISLNYADTATTKLPLKKMTRQEYDLYFNDSDRGAPAGYMFSMGYIYVLPRLLQATNFYLRYWQLPATLATNVDPEIPEDYQDLMVDYALHRAYLSEHDDRFSAVHKKLFDEGLLKLRSEAQYDDFDGPVVAGGTWSTASYANPYYP